MQTTSDQTTSGMTTSDMTSRVGDEARHVTPWHQRPTARHTRVLHVYGCLAMLGQLWQTRPDWYLVHWVSEPIIASWPVLTSMASIDQMASIGQYWPDMTSIGLIMDPVLNPGPYLQRPNGP